MNATAIATVLIVTAAALPLLDLLVRVPVTESFAAEGVKRMRLSIAIAIAGVTVLVLALVLT